MIGWEIWIPSCSCRNDGDSPRIQPMNIHPDADASVVAAHVRRIDDGTWRTGGRT